MKITLCWGFFLFLGGTLLASHSTLARESKPLCSIKNAQKLSLAVESECLKNELISQPKNLAKAKAFSQKWAAQSWKSFTLPNAKVIHRNAALIESYAAQSVKDWALVLSRLSQNGWLTFLPSERTAAFLSVCKRDKKATELCSGWIRRLQETAPSHSPTAKLLAERGYAFDSGDEPGVGAKNTQAYHAPDLDLAAFDAAFVKYSAGDFGDAASLLKSALEAYPKSSQKHRIRYWLARAQERSGDSDSARANFKTLQEEAWLTFYGIRASMGLKQPLKTPELNPESKGLSGNCRANELRPDEKERFSRGNQASIPLPVRSFELSDFRFRDGWSNGCVEQFVRLQASLGNSPQIFAALTEWLQRRTSPLTLAQSPDEGSTIFSLVFPARTAPQVSSAARTAEIDPTLFTSLVKQESGFDEQATSSAGALGLSQLLYATALDFDSKLERIELLSNPDKNLNFGARYLGRLINKYQGRWAYALAAYNAGPGNFDRWLKTKNDKMPSLEWMETLPYRETREYVLSIIRNFYWYNQLLSENPKEAAPLSEEELDKLFFGS